jgi:hypothetical protein
VRPCRILAVDPRTSRALVAEGVLVQTHRPRLWLVTPLWMSVAPPWLGAHLTRRLGWIPCELPVDFTDVVQRANEIAHLAEDEATRSRDRLGPFRMGVSTSRSTASFLGRRRREVTRAKRVWSLLRAHVDLRRSGTMTPTEEAAFRLAVYRAEGRKLPQEPADLTAEQRQELQDRIRRIAGQRRERGKKDT